MKKLDRYLLKELFVPFLIGTLSVLLMFQANQVIYILKTFTPQNVPMSAVFQMVIYKTPYWATMTLPVGTSLGASLAMSRLVRESELTAIRSAGAKILRVIAPIALFGVLLSVGHFVLGEKVMPNAEKAFNKLQSEVIQAAGLPTFNQNIGLKINNWYVNIGGVQRGSAGNLILSDMVLFERAQPKQVVITTAKKGSYDKGNWILTDTFVWVIQDQTLASAKAGKPMTIHQPIEISSLFGQNLPDEKSVEELKAAIERNKKAGMDTRYDEVQYHNRFAAPAACMVFALVSPIFAVWFARSGAFMGVLLSMILVLLYYNAYVICTEVIGRYGWTSPLVAAWLPNVLFVGLGLLAIRRLE